MSFLFDEGLAGKNETKLPGSEILIPGDLEIPAA